MGITEYAVSRAIIELQSEKRLITFDMIADRIGGGKTSVNDAIVRMLQSGALVRIDGSPRAGGYRYEYHGK